MNYEGRDIALDSAMVNMNPNILDMWAGMLPYKVLTGWERIAGLISNEYY
jgi:hypothetical protein